MTMCSLYVANLSGFDMKGGDVNGHIPPHLTSDFPPVQDNHFHGALEVWGHKRGIPVIGTDFDACVARVTKAQVLEFIAFCYDADESYNVPEKMLRWEGKAYLVEKLDKLRAEVAALPEEGEYGIASACW
jgi:hypothetical protein